MANHTIVLPTDQSAAQKFEDLLWVPNQVFFLVLGDSPEREQFVNNIADMATDWRYIIWAKHPELVIPRLLTLPLRPGVLPLISPFPEDIVGLSISLNNYICRVVRTAHYNEAAQAFLLAETFMQP